MFFIKNKYVIKDLVDFCLFSTINSISQRFIFNIMPTIIALFADNEAVTMFSIATTLEGYVFTFSQAVNGMFLPKISRINVSENQHEKLNSLMIKVGTFHIYTLGLLYIGFLLLGKDFISMWLGEGYFLVYACALLLMLPSLIDTPQQIARTALVVKNYMKEQSFIYVCMAVLNVLFSLVLVVRFKLIGAAISIVLAYLVRTILFNILYFYKLKINLKEYFKNVYSKWLGIGLLTVFLYSITFRLIPFEGLVFFLIKGISIVCIYAVLFVLFNRELVSKFVSNYYKNGGN